jgi:hypothetical protein
MSVCGGWSLVKHDTHVTRAITLWCRAWSCSDCRPFRLSQLKRMATGGQPSTFLTLTVNPAIGQSVEDRAQQLSDAMKLLLKRMRRKFVKAPIEYMAVFEETKAGEPHLHILMRAPFVPQRWISDTMNELIQSPIVDIRAVGSMKGVARYVAKYIAKGPRAFGTMKRYWTSAAYDLSAVKKEKPQDEWGSGWSVTHAPLWSLKQLWTDCGYEPEDINENEIAFVHRRRKGGGWGRTADAIEAFNRLWRKPNGPA